MSGGKLWILKVQIGDKRWFKGAKEDAFGATVSGGPAYPCLPLCIQGRSSFWRRHAPLGAGDGRRFPAASCLTKRVGACTRGAVGRGCRALSSSPEQRAQLMSRRKARAAWRTRVQTRPIPSCPMGRTSSGQRCRRAARSGRSRARRMSCGTQAVCGVDRDGRAAALSGCAASALVTSECFGDCPGDAGDHTMTHHGGCAQPPCTGCLPEVMTTLRMWIMQPAGRWGQTI